MNLNRREFLLAGAALSSGSFMQPPVVGNFTLAFPVGFLNAAQPVSIAAAASTSCMCQMQIFDGERTLLEGRKWGLEPRHATSVLNQKLGGDSGQKRLEVRAFVYPQGQAKPHMAGVIQSGQVSDQARFERTAERVFFAKDPAPRPSEGRFTINLKLESDMLLRIWQGENAKGPAMWERLFSNLQMGEQAIPWDLRNRKGAIVDAGDYLATLIAVPKIANRSKTIFFSTFQVI